MGGNADGANRTAELKQNQTLEGENADGANRDNTMDLLLTLSAIFFAIRAVSIFAI